MATIEQPARFVTPPGRLGHPEYELRSDPRSDPRMVAVLAAHGMDGLVAPAPVSPEDPLPARLEFMATAERDFEAFFADLVANLPAVPGVARWTETTTGVDGNQVTLYVHRPEGESSGSLPGVLHLHGGGMTLLGAAGSAYARFRDELAATGTVVIGVEFRNAAGAHGPHPFPSGLDDCTSGLEWAHRNRERLGLSKLIIGGESGGGTLSLATTIKAKRDGRPQMVDGVYAMVPFISGAYRWPDREKAAELPSLLENDGYFTDCSIAAVIASVYDPSGENSRNPLCWPYWATKDDLSGLPPHVISVNELDPFRDEGLGYYRKLARAGVNVTGRIVAGVCHAAEIMFREAMPHMYLSTINDVRGFADRPSWMSV